MTKRQYGALEIFDVKTVGELFKWAAGAFGIWFAEFFADFYQQCMVFIEKLGILGQIRLE